MVMHSRYIYIIYGVASLLLLQSSEAFNLCDDRELPDHAAVTQSYWFTKCNWRCLSGYAKVGHECCVDKPGNATWLKSMSSPCAFYCNDGFIYRQNTCCKNLPVAARWDQNPKNICVWRCIRGYKVRDQCVDKLAQDMSYAYAKKEQSIQTETIIDSILDREVVQSRKPIDNSTVDEYLNSLLELELRQQQADAYVEDLLNRLVEFDGLHHPDDTDVSNENVVDNIVDRELLRRGREAEMAANKSDVSVAALDSYLHRQANMTDEYDYEYVETEAQSSVESLFSEVDFLKATIRFQNERIKRRTDSRGSLGEVEVERLRKDLELARKRTEMLNKRAAEAKRKLQVAHEEASRRRERVLSVHSEKVEIMTKDGIWRRIRGALLDTGNANICTISTNTARDIGMNTKSYVSGRYQTIIGVIPGRSERWPIVNISLRVKGRIFMVEAAVGGDTPMIVSHPDVIAPLMNDDGYVIAGAGH